MIVTNQDRQSFVTLSAAKGLARWAHRGFAEFTLSATNGLSMTAPILLVNLQYRGASEARIYMQGFGYLVAAYAVAWVGLFVYLVVVMLRIRGVRTELAAVEELVREQQEKRKV
jgi:CcmD family protein